MRKHKQIQGQSVRWLLPSFATATAFALILASVIAFSACKERRSTSTGAHPELSPEEKATTELRPRTVTTAAVEEAWVAPPIRTAGILAGKKEIRLSFKVGGVVARVRVKEGERVKKGRVLAELVLDEIDAQVAQARQALEKAERDRARAERLYASKVATLEQYQDATTVYEVAKETLKVAEFNRRHATIIAPSDGRVMNVFIEEDELVAPGTPILQLSGEEGGLVVKAHVSERDLTQIAVGDVARIRVGAHEGRTFDGRVVEIAGAASPLTGTFAIEIDVETGFEDARTNIILRSGMSARADIEPRAKLPVRLIPVEAFLEGNRDQGWVYTITSENRARRLMVTTAFITGSSVAITGGLEGIKNVIVEGAAFLREGEVVSADSEVSHAHR